MIKPSDIGLPEKFTSFREYPNFSQWGTTLKIAESEIPTRIVCAPPGAGKSLLNVAAATILGGRTLYLTPTKQLQAQVNSDFPSFNLVGHSNYPCADPTLDDTGSLSEVGCALPQDRCPYWADVAASLKHDLITTNPSNWVSVARAGDPDRFGKFDNLILDEAHSTPALLCDMMSVKVSHKGIDELLGWRVPETLNVSAWISWAEEALSECDSELADCPSQDRKRRTRLIKLQQNLEAIAAIPSSNPWVVKSESYGNSLTPVGAESFVSSYLFRGIKNIILSSATITRYDALMLGLSPSEYQFTEIGSVFDPQRRPFIYVPTTTVDYRMGEGQRRLLINEIDRCICAWKGYKGIIHSVSYDNAESIVNSLRALNKPSAPRLLSHGKDSSSKRRAFDKFFSLGHDSVLVSPILTEGLDLAGDLARFGILYKVPTPRSDDPLVIAREKKYNSYKNNVRIKTIIQTCGRLMRNPQDWGTNYIFDDHWGNWMRKQPFPLYFRQSWETYNNLPEIRTF